MWTMAKDWPPRISHGLMEETEAQSWNLTTAIFGSAKIQLDHLLCPRPCVRLYGGEKRGETT